VPQPRDLMRHVLAPRDPHNPHVALRDSASPVARSISFVNVRVLSSLRDTGET